MGLNFYPRSRRYIKESTALDIVRGLPPFVEPVGLFVNQPMKEVVTWATQFRWLKTFQVHSDAPETLLPEPYRWVVAFPVRDRESLILMNHYLESCSQRGRLPDAILVDAHVPGEYGGTGRVAPWELLAEFRPAVPLILAGGLTPENVAQAIRVVRPYGVDVASGVEKVPGQKDVEKMRRFLDKARACM